MLMVYVKYLSVSLSFLLKVFKLLMEYTQKAFCIHFHANLRAVLVTYSASRMVCMLNLLKANVYKEMPS